MTARPEDPRRTVPAILVFAAAAGWMAGLELAVLEMLWNGYAALGFWRNASAIAWTCLFFGSLAGLAGGLLLLLLRAVVRRWWPALGQIRSLDDLNRALARLSWRQIRPFAAATAAAASCLGVAGLVDALSLRSAIVAAGFVAAGTAALLGLGAATAAIARAPAGSWRWRLRRWQWVGIAGVMLAALKFQAIRKLYGRMVHASDRAGVPELPILLAGTAALLVLAAACCRRRAGNRLTPALAASILLSIAAAWGAGRLPLESRQHPARTPNVVLIGLDTLRADRTSVSGEETAGSLTPNLARLASRGVTFRHAISQAPWTLPAFSSVHTGLYPHEHGAISLAGSLPRRAVTLAEVLRESGYLTAGVVSGNYVTRRVGLDQGFDRFDERNVLGAAGLTSAGVTREALRFLDRRRAGPFFLWAHYFDPHFEYRDHGDFALADDYRGWVRDVAGDKGGLLRMRQLFAPRDVGYLRDLYDEEILHMDAEVGRLLRGLSARGLTDDTMIVVVADHGEEFFERGWLGHGTSLHDELIRVPLVVVAPGLEAPEPVYQPTVETRSVYWTVLEYLGIGRRPPPGAHPLLPAFGVAGEPPPAEAFSTVWRPDAPVDSGKRMLLACYQTDDWKLVYDRGRGLEQLYDLAADPAESENLVDLETARAGEMRDKLSAWLERMLGQAPAGTLHELTEAEMEALKSLGYL